MMTLGKSLNNLNFKFLFCKIGEHISAWVTVTIKIIYVQWQHNGAHRRYYRYIKFPKHIPPLFPHIGILGETDIITQLINTYFFPASLEKFVDFLPLSSSQPVVPNQTCIWESPGSILKVAEPSNKNF